MELSGCRVRRLFSRRQQSDVSRSRSLHDDERSDSVLESDCNESQSSDDELFDITGLYIVRLLVLPQTERSSWT